MPTILGDVKRHFRDHGWAVRPPRRLQEVRAQVWAEEDRLVQGLQRWPTPAELAEALDLDPEEVDRARLSGAAYRADSLDAATDDGPGIDLSAPESGDVERLLRLQAVCERVSRLTHRERLIVHLRFVEGRTQSEIGAALGVSQMQVSRLLAAIIDRLRRDLGDVAEAA
jgi:RNA polymerase sigma-B factor